MRRDIGIAVNYDLYLELREYRKKTGESFNLIIEEALREFFERKRDTTTKKTLSQNL